MSTKLLAFFLIFSTLLIPLTPANAVKNAPESRYLVKSKANVWKNSFTVRNTFEKGFTADLTDWQLRVAKIFGIEVEPVAKLYISPTLAGEIVLSGTPTKTSRAVPDEQYPWGVTMTYSQNQESETLALSEETVTRGEGITIAVLDTGVVKTHPDLVRRISDCKDFTAPKQSMTNGKCDDENGHGTHVAGIIAADGGEDGKGIYGIVPDAELLAYKVCDQNGSCYADDVAVAIHTAVDADAQIINVSLGSDTDNIFLNEAVNYAADNGVLMISAAGNDGPYSGSIDYPAANTRVISVGALDDKLTVPDWSSRGLNTETDPKNRDEKDIEFAAPGVNIESTWKEGYAILSGTSMAVPYVVGIAALLWDFEAEDPAEDVREKLHLSTEDVSPPGEDDDSGLGLPLPIE